MIVDESEFVPEELWTNTIFPLNMEFQNSIIAATSPQSEDSYNHFLINLINPVTKKHAYNVVYLYEVCKACLDAGKPWKCTHNQEQLSASKNQATVDEVRAAYRPGQTAAKLRETFGVTTGGNDKIIQAEYITAFFNERVKIDGKPRCIYLAIDPTGGGDSELGVVGIVETSSEQGAKLAVSLSFRVYILVQLEQPRLGDQLVSVATQLRPRLLELPGCVDASRVAGEQAPVVGRGTLEQCGLLCDVRQPDLVEVGPPSWAQLGRGLLDHDRVAVEEVEKDPELGPDQRAVVAVELAESDPNQPADCLVLGDEISREIVVSVAQQELRVHPSLDQHIEHTEILELFHVLFF